MCDEVKNLLVATQKKYKNKKELNSKQMMMVNTLTNIIYGEDKSCSMVYARKKKS